VAKLWRAAIPESAVRDERGPSANAGGPTNAGPPARRTELGAMGVTDDDLASLLHDLGTTPTALLDATLASFDDLGGTLRDMTRDLRADAWRAPDRRRDDALGLAREVGDVVRDHQSAVAVLRALGRAPILVGDADGSLLDARLDAATRAMEGGAIDDDARAALQSALDRIDRYAVAVALRLGRPIPERPSLTEG